MSRWVFGRAPKGGFTSPFNCQLYIGGQFLPFYVPRPRMPQIDEEYYPELLTFLGGKVSHHVHQPSSLRPHQRIDPIKASLMTEAVRRKPILISEDKYVLDGNHRWLAHSMENTPINCLCIEHSFEVAIELLFQFPKTYTLATHPETN